MSIHWKTKILGIIVLLAAVAISFTSSKVSAVGYTIYTVDRFGNNSTPYEVTPTDTILSLKEHIYANTGVPVVRQQLIFAGDELEDDGLIATYNIQPDADITFIPSWILTFNNNIPDATDNITEVLVEDGLHYAPSSPSRDGYSFAGWYQDGATLRFDFNNTRIRENLSFTAYWVENITSLDITLNAPTVGETVTLDEMGDPDSAPLVSFDNPHVVAGYTEWVMGTCEANEACDESFSGTFEKNTDYYAFITVTIDDQAHYVFTDEVLANITVNGESPAELLGLIDSYNLMLIARIQPTCTEEDIPEDNQAPTEGSTAPRTPDTGATTGDYTAISAALIVPSLLGIVYRIIHLSYNYKKRS